jgi:hypothetical protein
MAPVKFNEAHVLFEKHLRELDIGWQREYLFHPKRKWRFDYVVGPKLGITKEGQRLFNANHPSRSFAVEIEGAIWSRGRHTRGKGYQADLDKYNAATMLGYRVLRFSTADILRGRAKAFLREWLCGGTNTK